MMGFFSRSQRSPELPSDVISMMEHFGRYDFNPQMSAYDAEDVGRLMAALYPFASTKPCVKEGALSKEYWAGLEMPLVESYIGLRSKSGEDEKRECNWPEKLLILYNWRCNIYSCVDCASPGQRVVRNDTNRDPDAYALEAPSLQQWLQALLDGVLLHFEWDTAEKVPF